MLILGDEICKGEIDGVDIQVAEKSYVMAAEQGDSFEQNYLDVVYESGKISLHSRANYDKALSWYQAAANLGNKTAHFNLGRCYFHCLGVEKDLEKTFNHMKEAGYEDVTIEELEEATSPMVKLHKSQKVNMI